MCMPLLCLLTQNNFNDSHRYLSDFNCITHTKWLINMYTSIVIRILNQCKEIKSPTNPYSLTTKHLKQSTNKISATFLFLYQISPLVELS